MLEDDDDEKSPGNELTKEVVVGYFGNVKSLPNWRALNESNMLGLRSE